MRYVNGDIIQLVYIDTAGKLTQRYVRVISTTHDLLIAYCYYRRKPRSFARQNILAVEVKRHEQAYAGV